MALYVCGFCGVAMGLRLECYGCGAPRVRALEPDAALSWREFEVKVESAAGTLNPRRWRVEPQAVRAYADGAVKRLDISVAERRQGGRNFVIDAKHFRSSTLTKHEVDSTEDYRRRSRGSAALLVVSTVTVVPEPVIGYADRIGVELLAANRNLASNLRRWFAQWE